MVSKIVSETVGSGITRHTRRRRVYTDTGTAEDLEELKNFFLTAAQRKYDPISDARRLAEWTLKAIEEGQTDPDDFKPRQGMGWYSREIMLRCGWLEQVTKRSDHDRREEIAFEIGVLITEARLKAAWDPDVEAAVKHSESRERANRANRKASAAERASIVASIIAETGEGVTNASREAALRFADKGAWTTFRDDYNAAKVSGAEGPT